MTIRIEVLWHLDNLRATAQHILQHKRDVTGRPPLRDLDDACDFLIQRLRRQLEDQPLEDVAFDTITVYRGYWAHLVMVQSAQQKGDRLVGAVGGMTFVVGGTATPGEVSDTFTIIRNSERTGTIVAQVTFLVDLTP